jgi:hypothetical protein
LFSEYVVIVVTALETMRETDIYIPTQEGGGRDRASVTSSQKVPRFRPLVLLVRVIHKLKCILKGKVKIVIVTA